MTDLRPYLMTLDPGLRGCGIAYWDANGVLLDARYLKNPVKAGRGPAAWFGYVDAYGRACLPSTVEHFVSEEPQVYVGSARTGDPDDLIQLAGVVGVFVGTVVAKSYLGVKPRGWKGSVPKDVHHARLTKTLDAYELALVEASTVPSLRHNVLDAVGLGKWWFAKGRTTGEKK